MTALRHILKRHSLLAAWLVALALVLKMAVPGGYMVGSSGGRITIELCSGYAPQQMPAAMPGMTHHPDKDGHRAGEMPCAFSSLTAPSLAAADPLLLAAAILFLFLTVFRLPAPPALPRAPSYLRPPLRGPPAHA